MGKILSAVGRNGYELVSVVPDSWVAENYTEHKVGKEIEIIRWGTKGGGQDFYMGRNTGWTVTAYICVFKRRTG
jgi:hypothetical protein